MAIPSPEAADPAESLIDGGVGIVDKARVYGSDVVEVDPRFSSC